MTSPAALVVLAACRSGQTASHDLGGEWLGFSGALMRIGVSDVVAGLWDVEPRATMRLIDGFYEAHLGNEQRPALSLATAMREQLRLGRLGEAGGPHPMTDQVSDQTQHRLRRLCASPLWWAGLVAMQAR
jgi:CHAT domain-containing protein